MIELISDAERIVKWMLWAGIALACATTLTVIAGRIALAVQDAYLARLQHRYRGLIDRALKGDRHAIDAIARCPSRDRVALVRLLIMPLISDRDPERIAATREIALAMQLTPIADRLLRSRWWWRDRATGFWADTVPQAIEPDRRRS